MEVIPHRGSLDFIRVSFPPSPRALPDLNCEYQISVGTAGPQ